MRRYVRAVHAVAASYLAEPEDIEDAAQETFLRAIRGIALYDVKRPFAPWLYQIARNVARSRIAAVARPQEDLDSFVLPSHLPGPDLMAERSEVAAQVRAAIDRLPERQRTALWLCDVEGYTAGEVGQIMGVSAGTVRAHLHHARRSLRAALARTMERANTGG